MRSHNHQFQPHKIEDVSAFILGYLADMGGEARISHLLRDLNGMGHDYKVSTLMVLFLEGRLDLDWARRVVSLPV